MSENLYPASKAYPVHVTTVTSGLLRELFALLNVADVTDSPKKEKCPRYILTEAGAHRPGHSKHSFGALNASFASTPEGIAQLRRR